ncbi:MAG: hypothetical protein ACRDMV_04425 [Streptosporangiales bacterium]
MNLSNYAKFIAALLAAAGVVASSGLLDGRPELWLNVAISAVGAAVVILVPNIDKYRIPAGSAEPVGDDGDDPPVPDLV